MSRNKIHKDHLVDMSLPTELRRVKKRRKARGKGRKGRIAQMDHANGPEYTDRRRRWEKLNPHTPQPPARGKQNNPQPKEEHMTSPDPKPEDDSKPEPTIISDVEYIAGSINGDIDPDEWGPI
jgi:hypothetical protein